MIKDGKYRFTLQFGMDTEEEKRAGGFLEKIGKRKSPILVAAVNEYLDNHPNLLSGEHKIQFQIKGIPQEQLEECVRRIVAEHLGPAAASVSPASTQEDSKQVSDDILEMLNDLDCFN